jgi:hypothetical protein
MEIHPPEKPIHTVKDFLLQLMTITIGILIALSLEGALEWQHHRALVSEARENLRQEMMNNKREIDKILAGLPGLKTNEEAAVRLIDDLQAHKAKEHRTQSLNFTYYLGLLSNTGWNTAQAAGAVAHMPYPDVQKYSDLYDLQRVFDDLQNRLGESVLAAVPPSDPDKLDPRELREWRHRIQTSLTYIQNLEGLARGLGGEYDKALR